jgi:hypothetical protein
MKHFHSGLGRLFVALGMIVVSLPAAPTALDFDLVVVAPGDPRASGVVQPWAEPQTKDAGSSEDRLASRTAPVAESDGGAIFNPFAGSNVVRVSASSIAIPERGTSAIEFGLAPMVFLILVVLGAGVVLAAWLRRA